MGSGEEHPLPWRKNWENRGFPRCSIPPGAQLGICKNKICIKLILGVLSDEGSVHSREPILEKENISPPLIKLCPRVSAYPPRTLRGGLLIKVSEAELFQNPFVSREGIYRPRAATASDVEDDLLIPTRTTRVI